VGRIETRRGGILSKYGEAAVAAVEMVTQRRVPHAPDAWEAAVTRTFPGRLASQRKGCPRGAFLGLCGEGLIKGVPKGSYTRSLLNKQYAVDAVALLRQRPTLSENPTELWHLVICGKEKVHNSQMDVVIALWRRGLVA
jgi:hypothetical protein